MLANGVKETTTTSGAGTVTLASATGYVRFAQAFAVGDLVSYAIQDGNNREWGIGTIGASNTLERTTVTAMLVSGTYTTSGAAAITLSGGSAEVICTLHAATSLEYGDAWPRKSATPKIAGDKSGAQLVGFTLTASRQYFIPFSVPRRVIGTGLRISVSGAVAGNASIGIYTNTVSGGDDVPGSLLVSVTGLDVGTTGDKTGTVDYILEPGLIYWASVISSSACMLRGMTTVSVNSILGRTPNNNNAVSYVYSSGSGSTLPDPSPSSLTDAIGGMAAIYLVGS